jgi:6-phospho-3-hexuloisomerase
MMLKESARAVTAELARLLDEVDEGSVRAFEQALLTARRVFTAGAGRSGLMMRAFAMRLMHLGLAVHVVGGTTTPSLEPGDLLVIGSGSGETASLQAQARKARGLGAGVALVTIVPDSTIGKLSDPVIRIRAPSPKAAAVPGGQPASSVQPMGSLFEQGLLLLLDIVVMRMSEAKGITHEQMFRRHANLE